MPEAIQAKEATMLILERRIDETIHIGADITIMVVGIKGNQVRLGINAPKDVEVHREEIYRRAQAAKAGKAVA